MFARVGILTSLRGYRREWLGPDAMAGLAIAAVAIPSAIVQVDSTAAAMLEEVRRMFSERGVAFGIAELHNDPRELLKRAGLLEKISEAMIFEDLEEAPTVFASLHRAQRS